MSGSKIFKQGGRQEMKGRIITHRTFLKECLREAYEWKEDGYTSASITIFQIMDAYAPEYFTDEYEETGSFVEKCFLPSDFAIQVIAFLKMIEHREDYNLSYSDDEMIELSENLFRMQRINELWGSDSYAD